MSWNTSVASSRAGVDASQPDARNALLDTNFFALFRALIEFFQQKITPRKLYLYASPTLMVLIA